MLPDNIMNIFGNPEIIRKYISTRSSSRGNFAVQYCRTKQWSQILRELNFGMNWVKIVKNVNYYLTSNTLLS